MPRLLDHIETPTDVRRLSVAELSTLATEVREEVISVVSEVGGHLASTLGAVELTLALHYVFDTPEDRIVWDTDIKPTRINSSVADGLAWAPFGNGVA